MKFLYHHRTASRDGQEVHIAELVAALRAAGHAVTVMSPAGDEAPERASGAMGGSRGGLARARSLVPEALLPLASRAYDLVFARRLERAGRAAGSQVLYERHALFNRAGMHAARRLGIPLVLEVNAPLAREQAALGVLDLPAALRQELAVVRSAAAVFAVTSVLKDILVEDGVDAERVHVVPNAIDPERFLAPRAAGAKERLGLAGRLVLGFVGFARPWHGLDRIVDALAHGEAGGPLAGAVLLIGGEGPAIPELLDRARALGVADRVIVKGVLARDEVPAFIDAFDVALQPRATAYASPLKLFEYLARGVPVLVPRQPNLLEVLVDGASAVMYDVDRPGDLETALERLCGDEELRRRIGAAGRERVVLGGFTWRANAERVAAVAEGLIA